MHKKYLVCLSGMSIPKAAAYAQRCTNGRYANANIYQKTVKERKVSPVTSLYPALVRQIYKHHLLHCERLPFILQNTAFQLAKWHILNCNISAFKFVRFTLLFIIHCHLPFHIRAYPTATIYDNTIQSTISIMPGIHPSVKSMTTHH